jgi:hypothetical protein
MVIKMKDLIKAQTDVIRKQHMWTEAEEEPKEKEPDASKKLKINIPDDPFEETKLKEVGAAPQYKKMYKDIQRAENQLAKSVDKMSSFLNKQGLKNQSMMLKGNYIQDVRDFVDKFLKGFIKELL